MDTLWWYLALAVGLNVLLFIPAFFFRTDKLTDVSYALTFIVLATLALFQGTLAHTRIIVVAMVLLWALRLGVFLLIRIHKMDKDKRFDGIRESFVKFAKFWVLQGVAVWIILIPSLMFLLSDNQSIWWIGVFVWAAGLATETIADIQKFRFKQDKKNKDKFIQSGLWKYSRHPNYFGEIVCWVGVYIAVLAALSPLQVLIGIVSPVFIATLLIFGTGIPPLEEYADKKWGDQKAYQEYKKKTSVLIPWFPR